MLASLRRPEGLPPDDPAPSISDRSARSAGSPAGPCQKAWLPTVISSDFARVKATFHQSTWLATRCVVR
ncbi:hypothetical protein [Streptomyces sp. CC77]|uniref:hypothetical protein n=1 Tax=Streptomyces sp. CC77 TaxID=1906739 RepID=UPI0015870280|nr:hypothetical protein [Streptomyces sp. CC77]